MKKALAILLALCMLLGLLTACGSTPEASASAPQTEAAQLTAETKETVPEAAVPSAVDSAETETMEAKNFEISMPLTEEPVSLSYFMRFNPQVQDWCQDLSDNLFYSTLEKLSGVHVDFQLLHPMNFNEQFNLQMASGDYADIYCEAASGYSGGYDKGVEDEVFLDLTPYIGEYAPNYNAIINANAQNQRDSMTDEGRIVFFVQVYDTGAPCSKGPQIRADWAREFGMDPAEIDTYEEYEAYIEQAYNTHGATVQLPMAGEPGFNHLTAGLETVASFGNSFEATLPWFQIDGQLQSGILTDGFKEYVALVADWYEKGWIYQDFMSEDFGMQGGADIGMITSGQSSLWWSEKDYIEQYNQNATDLGFEVAAIPDAVKNEGDATHLGPTNYESLSTMSSCVITTACQYPEIAIQWMDYRYTEEGSTLANWGVEGVSFEYDENGNKQYTDLIVNNPEGMTATLAQFRYMLQNTVCLTDVSAKEQGLTQQQLEAADIWMTNKDNSWGLPSTLTMTTDESDEYNSMAGDITTYGQENFLKYITGDALISDLDSFIQTCKDMGIEKCLEIRQASLDRYYQRQA